MFTTYDLVFEGGGAKGTVFVGALKALETSEIKPRRLAGTSAGAITATMLAAGYSAAELKGLAEERTPAGKPTFTTFMDVAGEDSFTDDVIDNSLTMRLFNAVDIPLVPDWAEDYVDRKLIGLFMKMKAYREIFSFIERGGLYAGDKFLAWIQGKLEAKGAGLGTATFEEFNVIKKADLSLVVSDTVGREMLVLNHRTAPKCPVSMAVRMSMSIPFVWQEVTWSPEWGTYLGKDISGHTIVDGGALSNFPLDLMVSKDAEVRLVMGDTDPDAAGTIGLLIDDLLEVPGAPPPADTVGNEEPDGLMDDPQRLKTVKRIMRLVNTMMEAHDRNVIDAYSDLVCHLPAKGYGVTEFDMDKPRMKKLIDGGEAAMKEFLDKSS